MSNIYISGDQFVINGERRPYRMRTSFCLLAHYQQHQRDKAKRWLDRIKEQGFDGPRLFGENQDWEGGPFYGTELTPKVRCFGNHSGPFSKLQLVDGYEGLVTQLAEDLIERDMVAEFCCIATVKGREEGWTGHGLNKFAQLFARLFPNPQDTPFLHETVNEIDAHAPHLKDKEEWKRMGPRWRRSNPDPTHHNYPGSTIGVSAGGQFLPGFDDLGYTHRNTHPDRGENWDDGRQGVPIEEDLPKLRALTLGRPLAFNETVHYMTSAEWAYWIDSGRIAKWRGLSTKDHERLGRYTEKVLAAGVSFCGHDMIGQQTNPFLPISPMELIWTDIFGGSVGPRKAQPIVDMVHRGYAEVLRRKPDEGGAEHFYNEILNGMSEARFREILLRSPEFKERFLDGQ